MVTGEQGARDVAVAGLRQLARAMDQAADRAADPVETDQRRRAATQLRFVAVLVTTGGWDDLAAPWLIAGRRLLAGYNQTDIHTTPWGG